MTRVGLGHQGFWEPEFPGRSRDPWREPKNHLGSLGPAAVQLTSEASRGGPRWGRRRGKRREGVPDMGQGHCSRCGPWIEPHSPASCGTGGGACRAGAGPEGASTQTRFHCPAHWRSPGQVWEEGRGRGRECVRPPGSRLWAGDAEASARGRRGRDCGPGTRAQVRGAARDSVHGRRAEAHPVWHAGRPVTRGFPRARPLGRRASVPGWHDLRGVWVLAKLACPPCDEGLGCGVLAPPGSLVSEGAGPGSPPSVLCPLPPAPAPGTSVLCVRNPPPPGGQPEMLPSPAFLCARLSLGVTDT